MYLACPSCSAEFPIEAGFIDTDGKRLAALFASMEPALGRAVLSYLRLFKPPKNALRAARAVRIVQQLIVLVDVGTVCRDERGGIRRRATPAMWADGIEQMLTQRGQLELPLTNHRYLRSVVFGLADRVDADAEHKKEADLRVGKHRRVMSEHVDPVGEQLKWLKQQREYGALSPEQYEAERSKIVSQRTAL